MARQAEYTSARQAHAIAVGLVALACAAPLAAKAPSLGIPGWTLEQAELGATATGAYSRLSYPVPGVDEAVAQRFRRAASLYTKAGSFPNIAVFVYDHLTRCGLSAEVRADDGLATGVPSWVRPAQVRGANTVTMVAVDGLLAVRQFGNGTALTPADDCPAKVAAAYAGAPETVPGAGVLSRHARAVLDGTRVGSKEAPLTRGSFIWTMRGKIASLGYLGGTELLGAYRDDAVTIVMIGDPGGTTRFATQYRNLPDGKWKFEGASALGLGLAKIVEERP